MIKKFRAGSQAWYGNIVLATDMKLQAEIMAKVQAARERARRKVEIHEMPREKRTSVRVGGSAAGG